MKPLSALFAICVIGFSFASAVRAADEEPWKSLFNGSDFAGWKVVALRDPAPAAIEDGAMVLRQRINREAFRFTEWARIRVECIGPTINA